MRIQKLTIVWFVQVLFLLLFSSDLQAQEPREPTSSTERDSKSKRKRARKARPKKRKNRKERIQQRGSLKPTSSQNNNQTTEGGPNDELDDQDVRGRVEDGDNSGIDALEDENASDMDQSVTTSSSGMRHSRHMEFDARLIKGETAGSGAVILFDRGTRHLPRLTQRRTEFLDATIKPVLGDVSTIRENDNPATQNKKETDPKSNSQPLSSSVNGSNH